MITNEQFDLFDPMIDYTKYCQIFEFDKNRVRYVDLNTGDTVHTRYFPNDNQVNNDANA